MKTDGVHLEGKANMFTWRLNAIGSLNKSLLCNPALNIL